MCSLYSTRYQVLLKSHFGDLRHRRYRTSFLCKVPLGIAQSQRSSKRAYCTRYEISSKILQMAAEAHGQSYLALPVYSVRVTNLRGNPSTGNRCTEENVLWTSCEVTLVIYPIALGLVPYVVHVICVPDLYSYGRPSSRSRGICQNILCSSCVVNACNVPDMKIVRLGPPLGPEIRRKCTSFFIERVLERAVMTVKKC